MKNIIGLLVIAMMFLCGTVYAQEVGILGIELGKLLINCKAGEGKRPCYHGYGAGLREVLTYPEHGLGDLYVSLDPSERAMQISLRFDADKKGDLILELLKDKFGKPHKIKQSTVQNQMGMSFVNINADWTINGHVISFLKRGSEVNKGFLALYHRDKVKELEEKGRKQERELKKIF